MLLMMSATSKNNVPCVLSLNPVSRPKLFFLDTPAMENGWHGKPAQRISKCSGMYFFCLFFSYITKRHFSEIG